MPNSAQFQTVKVEAESLRVPDAIVAPTPRIGWTPWPRGTCMLMSKRIAVGIAGLLAAAGAALAGPDVVVSTIGPTLTRWNRRRRDRILRNDGLMQHR